MTVWPSRIGSAWAHADGNGFNIQLETVPLDERIVLRVASEKPNNQLRPSNGWRVKARQLFMTTDTGVSKTVRLHSHCERNLERGFAELSDSRLSDSRLDFFVFWMPDCVQPSQNL